MKITRSMARFDPNRFDSALRKIQLRGQRQARSELIKASVITVLWVVALYGSLRLLAIFLE